MQVIIGILLFILTAVLIILIIVLKWSWWILFWYALSIILITLITVVTIKLYSTKPDIENMLTQKSGIPIEEVQDYVKKFVIMNDELADFSREQIIINSYTPKQMGDNKLTVNKVLFPRYWNDDNLFLAVHKDRLQVFTYALYHKDDKNAEKDFELRIDNAVTNPILTAEIEMPETDPYSMQTRIIKKRMPIDYLEKKQEEKEAEDQGVENDKN